MAQNIYDDPAFFAGYSQLPRQTLGLAGAPEWPCVRALLPDLTATRIVDLGCGFGWFARWARAHGAASVLGIDLSHRMIERANAYRADPGIAYRIADLEQLELPNASFDFAYSALAFHYVEDFARLAGAVHAALIPGGSLVFTIEHPIYMAGTYPRWSSDRDGRKSWPINRYSIEGERTTDWFVSGVRKYHRRLGTTLNTLIDTGFTVQHVEEFAPTPAQIAAQPDLAEEVERPMMLLVSAQR
jgi:SAM-dependent methyltransferase